MSRVGTCQSSGLGSGFECLFGRVLLSAAVDDLMMLCIGESDDDKGLQFLFGLDPTRASSSQSPDDGYNRRIGWLFGVVHCSSLLDLVSYLIKMSDHEYYIYI